MNLLTPEQENFVRQEAFGKTTEELTLTGIALGKLKSIVSKKQSK